MGRIKIDIERCKGCELCINVCPQGIIKMSKRFNSKGVHFAETDDIKKCTGCTLCAIICPEVSITVYK